MSRPDRNNPRGTGRRSSQAEKPGPRSAATTASAPPVEGPAGRFSRLLRNHPFWVAVAGAAATVLLALTLCTPHYETNDDATMNLIAGGLAFADRPDEHLLFTNVLVGLPLKWLYGRAPAFPWYGAYQLTALAAAACGSAYALLRVNPSPRQAAVAALFLGVGVLPCLAEVQFTKTAFLASLAGLLLFLAPLRGAGVLPRAATAAAAALVVLGALVRFDSFLLACVMAVPAAAVAVWQAPGRAARAALPLAAAAALAAALYGFNQSYYARDEAWSDFYAYNALRAEFTDYQRVRYTPEAEPAFRAAGWQDIDLGMMLNWFYADPERYSLDKLRQVVATVPPTPRRSLWQTAVGEAKDLHRFPDLLQLMLAGLCAAVLTGEGPRRFLLPAVLFGLAWGLAVSLGTYYWLPPRVAIPFFCGVFAWTALRPGRPEFLWPGLPGVLDAAAWLLAAGTLCWAVADAVQASGESAALHRGAVAALRKLNPREDQLFVVWRESLPFEEVVAPLEDPAVLRPFRCVSASSVLRTPFTERRLAEFDITDLYRAICDRPDVYLVSMPGPPPLYRYFQRYVEVHYGPPPEFREAFVSRWDPKRPLVVLKAVPAATPPGREAR